MFRMKISRFFKIYQAVINHLLIEEGGFVQRTK